MKSEAKSFSPPVTKDLSVTLELDAFEALSLYTMSRYIGGTSAFRSVFSGLSKQTNIIESLAASIEKALDLKVGELEGFYMKDGRTLSPEITITVAAQRGIDDFLVNALNSLHVNVPDRVEIVHLDNPR